MNRDASFEADWQDLKDGIETGRVPSPKSVMWENLIRDFRADGAEGGPGSEQRGYNFLRASDEGARLKGEKLWLWATFLASAAFGRVSTALWDFNLDRSSGPLMTYPKFYRALKLVGIADDYARFCAEMGISTCSFNTAKLFYASSVFLDSVARSAPPPSVLEIGGGTGNLAVMINRRRPIRRYVIVDLPEMLLHSSRTIRRYLPDTPVAFAHRQAGAKLELPDNGFLLVPHYLASRLPDEAFDAAINVDSFQEMSAEQVYGYLDLIGRCARPNAVLMTINRRKQVGTFDNNPLRYPYPASEVIRWENDAFYHSALRVDRKDLHLLRVEKIRKAEAAK